MMTARPPLTGCWPRQTFAPLWALCAARGSEGWLTCWKTRPLLTTRTSPTSLKARVSQRTGQCSCETFIIGLLLTGAIVLSQFMDTQGDWCSARWRDVVAFVCRAASTCMRATPSRRWGFTKLSCHWHFCQWQWGWLWYSVFRSLYQCAFSNCSASRRSFLQTQLEASMRTSRLETSWSSKTISTYRVFLATTPSSDLTTKGIQEFWGCILNSKITFTLCSTPLLFLQVWCAVPVYVRRLRPGAAAAGHGCGAGAWLWGLPEGGRLLRPWWTLVWDHRREPNVVQAGRRRCW